MCSMPAYSIIYYCTAELLHPAQTCSGALDTSRNKLAMPIVAQDLTAEAKEEAAKGGGSAPVGMYS